jgi:cyclophilin family peptidyl-prolyl cis-trans isomerase
MYDLIRTTYERSFDKNIVYKYLHSNSEVKTKAAILSIAQSDDTTFVPELLKLDLNNYGSEIFFALAQIGKCDQSINFLWKYLQSSPLPNQFPKIFFAIGKIGSESDLQKLVEFYNSFDGPIFPYEGISEAILQFQIRGIKSDEARAILETEITHQLATKSRIEHALFTLSRYKINNISDAQMQRLFESDYTNEDEVFKQFVLMNVNRQIEIDQNVLTKLLESNSPLTKIQLVKVLNFLKIDSITSSNEIIEYYVLLLNDANQNVAIQAIISLRDLDNITVKENYNFLAKNFVISLYSNKTKIFRGELLLTYNDILNNHNHFENTLDHFDITFKYRIKYFAKQSDTKNAFNKISSYYLFGKSLGDKIESLSQILDLKLDSTLNNSFKKIVLDALNSNAAPLISIAADGIDSVFKSENSKQLKEIISNQIDKCKDNPDFLEATMSLINLSEKIEADFYKSMIEKASSSKLYSIRKFVSSKTGNNQIGFKELDKFKDIWSCAFKYEEATIKTSKGNIVIQFNSDIAPISVANFCLLVKQNFYDGIIFHRVVPGFVIQTGDPTATGWGGPGYDIISEFSDTDFGIGYVGMASAGKDTESSQIFIMQGSHPHLDSRYTSFAKVIEGMDVVYNIIEEDKIISIKLK